MARLAIPAMAGLVLGMAGAAAQPAGSGPVPVNAPHVALKQGRLAAKVYLPDPDKGFYRGTRFDWTGQVGSLIYGGQEFYGPWFDRVAPDVRDFQFGDLLVAGPASAITGPVEEYDPIGYDEAAPGGTFVKIGIGVLRKPDGKPHDHYRIYPIVDGGTRGMHKTANGITFTQDVRDAASGYGFSYVKQVELAPGGVMRIRHTLINTGARRFATTVYDHNFLRLAKGNEGLVVTLPFAIKADTAPPPELAKIEGNRLVYQRALTGKERVSFAVTGYGDTAADYDFRVTDSQDGASVRMQGDQPLARIFLWSIRSVMALEPYIAIDLPPGAAKSWTYTYTYTAPH
jgi:hypothetical protein